MACLEDDEIYDITNEWKSEYTINLNEKQRKNDAWFDKSIYLSNIIWIVRVSSGKLFIAVDSDVPDAMCSLTMDVEVIGELPSEVRKLEFEGSHTGREFYLNLVQTLKIRFTVTNVKGFFFVPFFDYSKAFTDNSNVVFLIEGKKIRANKQLLSLHSPVFHAMFNSEFREKNQEDIELKDVNKSYFLEVLRILYPQRAKPCKSYREKESSLPPDVEGLLQLGDRFQIQAVIDYCERSIMELDFIDKDNIYYFLASASKYGMYRRMKQIVDLAHDKKINIHDFLHEKSFKDSPNDLKLFIYANFTENRF